MVRAAREDMEARSRRSASSAELREWIDWFLFERESHSGEILKAHDAEGNEICYDIKSLWEEIPK
jgi:hypothetical protein